MTPEPEASPSRGAHPASGGGEGYVGRSYGGGGGVGGDGVSQDMVRDVIRSVASELVVRSGHSAQSNPEAIEEVRRILIEHVAKRMNRTVGFLFEQWWKYVDFELRMRATLEKAVKLMQNRVLGAAWGKWAHCVEEARAKRHFTRSCWRRWTFSVGLCKDESEREKKLAVVLKRMMFGNSAGAITGSVVFATGSMALVELKLGRIWASRRA